MRINKYLAECGLASRRKSEQFVLDGMVSVNGKVVRDLSFV
ncbi:MAG: pseudouridine synthase, partial [Clostridia bacterium]|nr:pseudouridine synthase [Clostridia bacterium]